MNENNHIETDTFNGSDEETMDDSKSNSLTEILSILYVTIVLIVLFLKIMFG